MIRTSASASVTARVLHPSSSLKVLRPFLLARTRHLDSGTLVSNSYRLSRPVGSMAHMNWTQKEEGDISSVFASLDESRSVSLPDRFIDLKKALWKDSFTETWKEVLSALESATEEISEHGSKIVPRIPYSDIRDGKVTDEQILEVKKRGCVVITGGIPPEEALTWKKSIQEYAAINKDLVKGFPSDNIQVYEIYNSKSQVLARTHPAVLDSQRFLLSLWNTQSTEDIDLKTPISYFDRLRIRLPGDNKFTLGPHMDGGSIERWEDPTYRLSWSHILNGQTPGDWKKHDPYSVGQRLDAKSDMYATPNQCSIFRPWQGWTAMSYTGPGEGTLKVLPMCSLATAYIILRPFFRPKSTPNNPGSVSFKADDWEPDLDTPTFPGSAMRSGQELHERTHPHLRLDQTMVPIGNVQPGDQVYWHCDLPHAVEAHHGGKGDASVMYIPAVPLTRKNAMYLLHQRETFLEGYPPPDFPGGSGESKFAGRPTAADIPSVEGKRALGLAEFDVGEDNKLAKEANDMLFSNRA